MKKLFTTVLACSLLLTGCGTATKDATTTEKVTTTEITQTQEDTTEATTEATSEVTSETTSEETTEKASSSDEITNLFETMPKDFSFSSGAGGWSTDMVINADGTFSGSYHDSDMGDLADEYPNGTIYVCDFSGKFSEPVKVDEYTYSMKIESIELEGTVGTEEIKDGTKYIYSDAYGLDNADELIVYLPGKATAEIPDGAKGWFNSFLVDGMPDTIPFYAIYNVKGDEAFVGVTEE